MIRNVDPLWLAVVAGCFAAIGGLLGWTWEVALPLGLVIAGGAGLLAALRWAGLDRGPRVDRQNGRVFLAFAGAFLCLGGLGAIGATALRDLDRPLLVGGAVGALLVAASLAALLPRAANRCRDGDPGGAWGLGALLGALTGIATHVALLADALRWPSP